MGDVERILTEKEAIELLVRIDERTTAMQKSLDAFEKIYVTHQEFVPVKVIAYGLVGLCMTGIIGALLAIIFKK